MNKTARLTLLGLACLVASGCAMNTPRISKENCLFGIGPKDAVVVIYMDPLTKKPAANPADCYVPAGGNVTFTTPDDAKSDFEILFDKGDGSPARSNDGDFVGVKRGAKAYVVNTGPLKPHEPDRKNVYAYTIEIDGKKTDPSLIIYPN